MTFGGPWKGIKDQANLLDVSNFPTLQPTTSNFLINLESIIMSNNTESGEPNKATGRFHSLKGTVVETVSPFTLGYRQY